ncbi:hypothetical protein [Bradyrhizobium sp. 30]|uniref:hypothetical protein n=1 Tax=Bradyrhizobium sp. 30 TaxID=2782669 RepID=UPI001FF8FE05|nr:hypothetical protein [Bradyrhizobium sp. 30]MCK1293446.1 hypothetical protein [Bradyrhizobium sp. 30]
MYGMQRRKAALLLFGGSPKPVGDPSAQLGDLLSLIGLSAAVEGHSYLSRRFSLAVFDLTKADGLTVNSTPERDDDV